jgi:hypothetical protein
MERMERIFLTRRNLLVLLSKLDRKKAGDVTLCSIVKNDNQHSEFPQSMACCMVTAVEDEEYYTDRKAGEMLPVDVPEEK